MTTIIVHKNKIAADKRIRLQLPSNSIIYEKVDSKIYRTECGRAAFVYFFELVSKKDIKFISDAFINALITMKRDDTYPNIYMERSVLHLLGRNINVLIGIKDEVYYFGRLDDFKLRDGLNKLVIMKPVPDRLISNGSGEFYAMGIHRADPRIPIGEIIERVAQLDFCTSTEHDVVDCAKLKPLYKEVSLKRKKK